MEYSRAGQSARYREENIGTRDIGECPYSRADLGVRAIQTKYDGGGLLVADDATRLLRRAEGAAARASDGVLREREGGNVFRWNLRACSASQRP